MRHWLEVTRQENHRDVPRRQTPQDRGTNIPSCPNSMIVGINGNATGGTWECRLYEDGDFISGTDFDVDYDVTAEEFATLIETANGYDPDADPVVGFPAYVTGGPGPFTGFIIKLKKGWHLSVHGNSLTGTGNPIPFVTPCCGST